MTAERIARLREHVPTKNPGAFAAGFTRSDMLFLLDLAEEALRLRGVVERAALTCQSCGGKGFAGTYNVDCFACRDLRAALPPRGENEETK